jgi:hypothetical protein
MPFDPSCRGAKARSGRKFDGQRVPCVRRNLMTIRELHRHSLDRTGNAAMFRE